MNLNKILISGRTVSSKEKPFVIAEIGINHEGNFDKAIQMVEDLSLIHISEPTRPY